MDCSDDREHKRGIGNVAFGFWVVDDCAWLGDKHSVEFGWVFESVFSELDCAVEH